MNGSHEGLDTPRTDPPVPAGAPVWAQAELARQYPQAHGAGGRGASPPRKSPVLAGVLSTLPGIGQVYVGYYTQNPGYQKEDINGTRYPLARNNILVVSDQLSFSVFPEVESFCSGTADSGIQQRH